MNRCIISAAPAGAYGVTMQSQSLASFKGRQLSQNRPVSITPPWQAVLLLIVLTIGCTIHAFPQAIQPLAQYGNGMFQAAKAWRTAPPANSPEYLGR